MDLAERVRLLAEQQTDTLMATRHHLHANPELSFEEHETMAYVAAQFTALGIEHQSQVAGTGVVGMLQGGKGPGPVLALRADMDALPITEANQVPYKSKREGVMHACGHDVHTTCLLGAAQILKEMQAHWAGTLKLIFQPAEERTPGGASLMIKEGVLQNPAPIGIMGQHVLPFLEVGQVGFRQGMYMASADELYITVTGKGGHGAMPEHLIDPVVVSAHIILGLQQISSRMADPKVPTVLSIGTLMAKGATNVIPNQVYMEGTFRTMNEPWRERALKEMKHLAESIAGAYGATCNINIQRGYPVLVNDPALTQAARANAETYLGAENVVELDLWMAAEDFAWYTHQIPGCFYRLGTGNKAKGITSGVHTPTFDIDENALPIGAGLLAYNALKLMGN